MPAAYADTRWLIAASPGTTITIAGTAYKANQLTSLQNAQLFQDDGLKNRMRYTGTATRLFLVTAAIELGRDSGTGTIGGMFLFKNGSALTVPVQMSVRLGTGANDPGEGAMAAIISLDQNDYIEIWITSNQSGDVCRIRSGQVSIVSIT